MRFLTIIFLAISFIGNGQGVQIGSWRFHPSLKNFNTVSVTGDDLYAGSNETILKYSFKDNSITLLSKEDGFSDVGASRIAYNDDLEVTLIGYVNGNIDLIKENQIINISDIKRKTSLTGSKKINHISFYDNFAYLSTNFGLVLVDLQKEEIKEAATNIGPNGQQVKVYSSTFNQDSVFIATSKGVLVASLEENLLNFNNWTLCSDNSSFPKDSIKALTTYKGQIYGLVSSYYMKGAGDKIEIRGVDESGLYKYKSGTWTKSVSVYQPSNGVNSNGGKLFVSAERAYYVFDGTSIDSVGTNSNVKEVVLDKNQTNWIADSEGVFSRSQSGAVTRLESNSLSYSGPFNMAYCNDAMLCFYGGYKSNTVNFFNSSGFEMLKDGRWENYSSHRNNFPPSYDLLDAVYNSVDGKIYIASYGWGLFVFEDGKVTKVWDNTNSPLVNMAPGSKYIRVTNLAVDLDGSIWVANNCDLTYQKGLHKLDVKGEWTSYDLPMSGLFYSREMEIDKKGNKWFWARDIRGIMVFNESNPSRTFRKINTGAGRGNLPDGEVSAVAVDKEGSVWVGTGKGVAVLHSYADPFTEDFSLPYFDGFPLLMDKEITSIEVDGGNRKWVGTKEGLWLFNEDGTEVIESFTTVNSPLPSNEIKDIEVHGQTGEVFIITNNGLVSFRGASTEAEKESFSDVKVFPNPVRKNFDGQIGISGLAYNAPVKITDVFGNLVYETEAEGGTATWNGRNYKGEKASTGVYLIFSATIDGEEGNVAKVAIIE